MFKVEVVDCAIELTPKALEGGRLDTASDLGPLQDTSTNATLTNLIEETTIQELPPVDGGWKAWQFVASAFVLEAMIWGYEFRSVRGHDCDRCILNDSLHLLPQLRYLPR